MDEGTARKGAYQVEFYFIDDDGRPKVSHLVCRSENFDPQKPETWGCLPSKEFVVGAMADFASKILNRPKSGAKLNAAQREQLASQGYL